MHSAASQKYSQKLFHHNVYVNENNGNGRSWPLHALHNACLNADCANNGRLAVSLLLVEFKSRGDVNLVIVSVVIREEAGAVVLQVLQFRILLELGARFPVSDVRTQHRVHVYLRVTNVFQIVVVVVRTITEKQVLKTHRSRLNLPKVSRK